MITERKSTAARCPDKIRRYPKFAEAINSRYARYNEALDKISEMEERGEIFVIRPSRTVNIKRVEKDAEKLQEMYDLGVRDCSDSLLALRAYLNK